MCYAVSLFLKRWMLGCASRANPSLICDRTPTTVDGIAGLRYWPAAIFTVPNKVFFLVHDKPIFHPG